MTRGIGAVRAIHRFVPEVIVPVFAALTYLGSMWFVAPLLVALFVFWDRERAAFVASVVVGGVAITIAAKHAFALPRPPVSLHQVAIDGYGFPSGHAMTSTVTYGSLARVVRRGTRRQRGLLAAGVISIVALSRLVLGVHYLVDVVVGAAVGLTYLAAVWVLVDDLDVGGALLLALVPAVVAVVVAGGTPKSLLALAAVVVGLVAWRLTRGATLADANDADA